MIEPARMVLGGDIEMRTCGKKDTKLAQSVNPDENFSDALRCC
jgi:hypothetical protein